MTSVFAQLTPVQAVLIIGVRIRALDFRLRAPILGDAVSAQLAESIGEEVTRLTIPTSVVHLHAVRAKTFDDVVRRFVAAHPDAVVLDLGCGLDPRRDRCDPPPGVDWYDIDFPEVIRLRQQYLPGPSHLVGVDLASSGWLDGIPAERPTVIVSDGLMALLPGDTFKALARALTSHFRSGEFAFNAYTPLALRNGQRVRGPLSLPIVGEGIVDPHEPENWGARLSLIEKLLLARAPEVAHYTQPLRTIARLSALSTRISRAGDRVVRYAF